MFKKQLQHNFKFFIQKIFVLIYGKVKILNLNNQNNEKIVKIDSIKSDKNPNRNYLLYKIYNGRIYTDTNQNVAIIDKDNFISSCSFQHVNNEFKDVSFNNVLIKGTPRIKKKFTGTIFNLTQGSSGNNYFHFIFDLIPKIYLLKKLLPIESIDYFYVPKITEWQKRIYSIFNIDVKKLIDSDKFRHIQGDLIIAVSHPWYFKSDFQSETKNIPEWIVSYNRNKFLPLMKKFDNNKKIFLDRSSSKYNHCQIVNFSEISNILMNKGFTKYNVENLDFEKQIYLFNQASVIIGAHGAAFTNLLFCKPRTKIIEIIPSSHESKKCKRISEILNLDYQRIETRDHFKENYPESILLDKYDLKKIENIIDLY